MFENIVVVSHKQACTWVWKNGMIEAAALLCAFLYMVAGEVASIAKTYRRISKCALNMYIDAYISHIPLESLSSQSSHTHLQACLGVLVQL